VTVDGLLDPSCVELLQSKYGEQVQIVVPSSIPTIEQLREVRYTTLAQTGSVERSYQALRRFMGLQVWPHILIISNCETLSNDQALCLRACSRGATDPNEITKPLLMAAFGLLSALSAQSANIKISSLPFNITAPGTYVVTGNLTFPATTAAAITISTAI
jgi:hypothetical protein